MRRALALLLLLASLAVAAQPSGPPTQSWPDGSRYWGQLLFGVPHGRGTLTAPDGRLYEGEFRDGRFHGEGRLRMPNGEEIRGVFANGRYQGPATPRVDDAAQRRLLEAALASLRPGERGRISLYLLAIAGDGSQEVFRREVEYVRAQFDRDYGTAGRSVALVNSRNTAATAPMATLASIRESLQAIAARMDRDNDILFLFVTSHGSKDHEIKLAINATAGASALPGLRPRELAQMLEEARVRWKVLVVSACYSGGFIEALRSDSTLVITAAREDRASFGCADENELTQFGRAFFKEALPKAASFQDAFGKAEALVGEWERNDLLPIGDKSLPQMHSPRPIAEQLGRWWSQRDR